MHECTKYKIAIFFNLPNIVFFIDLPTLLGVLQIFLLIESLFQFDFLNNTILHEKPELFEELGY